MLRLAEHPDFDLAVPTPDHFIPLLYTAALAAEAGDPAVPFVEGPAYGSLSMACYGVGLPEPAPEPDADGGAACIPDPDVVPTEHTNL